MKTFIKSLLLFNSLLLTVAASGQIDMKVLIDELGLQSNNLKSIKLDNSLYKFPYLGRMYYDIKVPEGYAYLYLQATGGDGRDHGLSSGGQGALIAASFEVGQNYNQIKPGGTLRFIIGQAGPNTSDGGGGTGVAYLASNSSNWRNLIIAGGGGGAGGDQGEGDYDGEPASTSSKATSGKSDGTAPGESGQDGEWINLFGEPGGGYLNARNSQYEPVGATNRASFGYGGGGFHITAKRGTFPISNTHFGGGGGGGYSGGGGGLVWVQYGDDMEFGGGGGSSFIDSYINTVDTYRFRRNVTRTPNNGFVLFQFSEEPILYEKRTIQLANQPDKCIQNVGNTNSDGNNIQLGNCQDATDALNWFYRYDHFKLSAHYGKCLDLKGGATGNGTNIQLWGCGDDWKSQQWIYDGIFGTIRSFKGFRKCLSLSGTSNNPSVGTNIHLWDCKEDNVRQQWQIDGATKVDNPSGVKTIRPVAANGLCLNLQDANSDAGNNVRLWTCANSATEWQGWRFDLDGQIHLNAHADKCLGVLYQTSNVHIWNCDDNNFGQVWIYDGITQSFRWTNDSSKCLQVDLDNGSYEKRDNIKIASCDGGADQQFVVQ